jgi:DNA-directed RNA polymerase subunit omega
MRAECAPNAPIHAGSHNSHPMQSNLLEEASKVITNPQVLINVISRRVKQLTAGHRPLVEVNSARMGSCDIALTEVIQLKLTYELVTTPAPGVVPPAVVAAVFTPKKMAA